MAQASRKWGGRGVPGWAVLVGAALSCAVGAGAHALVADGGVELARAADAPVADAGELAVTDADGQEANAAPQADEGSREEPVPVVVHVDGAVASPGVYELAGEGVRVGDAVEAAGGLLDEADLSTVNLAAPVHDGEKVHVPAEGEEPAVVAEAAVGGSAPAGDGTVDINTAGLEELMALPGVGEATAAAIIEDRERLGPFDSPEDIMRVSGIGEKKFERMREKIRVS